MNEYKKRGKPLKGGDQRKFEELSKKVPASSPELSPSDDAVDDLDGDWPRQVAFSSLRYRRDPKVRQEVRKRAKGKCELCGDEGFRQPDGSRYVECHHIIALADDGEDRASNVIALCPGHHREAHFGQQGRELEKKMIHVLKRLGLR
jgi:predicted restriction endonuclease